MAIRCNKILTIERRTIYRVKTEVGYMFMKKANLSKGRDAKPQGLISTKRMAAWPPSVTGFFKI
jgi:hypothetical protein